MEVFRSAKLIDGFSTCFRQHVAESTHCKFLHGYAISFKVTFEGELDYRNWVVDFGFMKRSQTKMEGWMGEELSPDAWFKNWFDHTVVIAADDPYVHLFEEMSFARIAQVRVLPKVGCEMFAKFVYDELNKFLYHETDDRVRVVEVECFEHAKNSASYLTK